MPWFRELSAEERPGSAMIVQAGIPAFVDWYRDAQSAAAASFAVAAPSSARPRARWRARSACSAPSPWCGSRSRWSSRTSTTWSARRRADVRGSGCATAARSPSPPPRSTPGPPRCAAPGTPGWRRWSSTRCCAARATRHRLAGQRPGLGGRGPRPVVVGTFRRAAHRHRLYDAYAASRTTPGPRPLRRPGRPAGRGAGRRRRPRAVGAELRRLFGEGPVVVGPVVDDLGDAHVSARAALAGLPRRRAAGPTHPGRCTATTCSPSGRWPATGTPAAPGRRDPRAARRGPARR